MQLLLKLLGKAAFPDAAAAVLDESLPVTSRYWILEALDEDFGFEFTEGMADELPSMAGLTKEHFRLDEIRAWAAGGYGKQVAVPIEIPLKQLKKEKIALPDDYRKISREPPREDRVRARRCVLANDAGRRFVRGDQR